MGFKWCIKHLTWTILNIWINCEHPQTHEALIMLLRLATRRQTCCTVEDSFSSYIYNRCGRIKIQQKQTNNCLAFLQLKSERVATYWLYFRKQSEILSLVIQSNNLNVFLIALNQKQDRHADFTALTEGK